MVAEVRRAVNLRKYMDFGNRLPLAGCQVVIKKSQLSGSPFDDLGFTRPGERCQETRFLLLIFRVSGGRKEQLARDHRTEPEEDNK